MSLNIKFFKDLEFSSVKKLLFDSTNVPNFDTINHIHLIAASTIVSANSNSALQKCLKNGLIICDSKPLHLFLKISKISHDYQRGADFFREMTNASESNKKHLLIVSSQALIDDLTVYINQLPQRRAKFDFFVSSFSSDLNILATEIEKKMDLKQYDFVWIGLGSPKQDFIAENLARENRACFIAIGAALEFVAQRKKEAPLIWQKVGLEWLFRLLNEPHRLWRRYLVGNFVFTWIVFRCVFHNLLSSPEKV